VNPLGAITTSNAATYALLNYGSVNATNLFKLSAVPGILNSGFTATLNATTNQLQLIIAPTLPTGTIADVRHVVIFMQENRSFDHYFGSLHGVHGYSDHVMLTFTNGNSDLYEPSGSGYELPFHTTDECLSDLDHSWSATHEAIDSGWNDGWIAAKGTETMAYYNRSDLSYYYSLADNFTICDEYHCSILSSTDPNRVFFMTGWNDPDDLGGGPLIDNTEPANGWGTNWVTYPELLQKAGVSWKIYQASDNYDDNALNWFAAYKDAAVGTPLYQNGEVFAPSLASGTGFQADYTNLVTEFKNAVISNTLPSVSWIIGPDVGSEHPSWSPEDGEILTKGLLDALASNPKVYNSTVFILNYDENDGFYDHAVPINPPTGTTNEFDSGLPYGLGIRVPCILISPWSTGGYVDSQVFDHTSIIRFLEKWTGVTEPNISAWRRMVCGDLTSAFDFTHVNTNYPSALTVASENDCSSGSTATPPGTQTVPVQEAGTLLERPLPYQPNATPVLNSGANSFAIILTNSGSTAMHFTIYANAYSTIAPKPYDISPSNSATASFSIGSSGGKYDFSCYSANGFLRRFAGNLGADADEIESVSYLNPVTDGLKITLANPGNSSVVFSVTNGYLPNSLTAYTVPAGSTNIVAIDTSANVIGTATNAFGTFTNSGWYDLTVTASGDNLFVRRFAGHIETAPAPAGIVSSENPSGFKDNVTFTGTFVGYGTPTGTAQFMSNGVALGSPITLINGAASLSTALLPRGTNQISVVYSGDSLNASVTNSLTQEVLNHPPVPATVVYQRAGNLPLNINISDLLTNVTDVDGDTITLVGVGTDGYNLLTTNGVTLSTNAAYITYTNSVNPGVNDSFEYAVSDGYGGISLGTVLIMVGTNYVAPTRGTLIVSPTGATVNFFGTPGEQYEVDRSTNLLPGVGLGWVSISTNVAPASGIIQVSDQFQDLGIQTPPTPPAAFYRLRPNP
jgi:phospholipase C